jgi:hypothetical protein
VNAFDSTLWVAVVVLILASGLVAWLLRSARTDAVEERDPVEVT